MRSMAPEAKFFQTSSDADLWQRYCGFLDLSVEEFMEIQRYLLLEQVKLMAHTPLARKIMGGSEPDSVEMYRSVVPITTYDDYVSFLGTGEQGGTENGALVDNPYFWCHSAGRGGNVKWIPYTTQAFDRIAKYGVAVAILSAAEKRGEICPVPGDKVLVNLAPRPYASGTFLAHLMEYFPYKSIPSLDDAESMEFGERTKLAFEQGLSQGIDYIFSVSTVLAKIGEKFSGQEHNLKLRSALLRPRVLRRLVWAWMRSKLARRPMMPRDLWSLKGLVTFGVDTPALEEKIATMWGKVPYQVYGTTEMMISAVQSWNKKGMTFLPDMAFWEFIPEDQWERLREDPSFQPATVLMNELEAGKQYELVYSHFHGMPLMRYRIGDVIKVESLGDAETGAKLPQISFQARASDIIDLAGLTQIDEKTLGQAIAETGITCEEWCARKEYSLDSGYLRVYLELKENREPKELEDLLEYKLRDVDVDYRDLEGWLDQRQSVAVTLISPGSFAAYYGEKAKEGAPIARLKPFHINPSDSVTERLLQISEALSPSR